MSKKFLIDSDEYVRIQTLYESYGINLISEDIGQIARDIRKAGFIKDVETAKSVLKDMKNFVSYMDEIINTAKKIKSITSLDDIAVKLIHIYNPGQLPEKFAEAKTQVINLLNGYSQTKGFQNYARLKDDVVKAESSAKSASGEGQGFTKNSQQSNSYSKSADNDLKDMFKSGSIVSGNSLRNLQPDWSQVTYAKNWDEYNKIIDNAITTGNFNGISRKGFERYGLTGPGGFREWIQNLSKNMDFESMTRSGTKDWFFKLR